MPAQMGDAKDLLRRLEERKWHLELEVYEAGDQRHWRHRVAPDGSDRSGWSGFSLRELRELLGGDRGVWKDPVGREYPIDIAHLRDHDPDNTRVKVRLVSDQYASYRRPSDGPA